MIKKINRFQGLRGFFIVIFFMLSVRLYFLQVMPTEKVQANYTNHQTELISDMKYMLLDTNGKDLNNYNKDYVIVIDSKPFKLNNYGEALQGLLAFNFIMKEEISTFSFNDIMKVPHGKSYYKVSKETFDKVKEIKNVKGVYTYIYDKKDTKDAWSIDGMFSNLDKVEAKENTLDYNLQSQIKDNELPSVNFYRDSNTVYSSKGLVENEKNKNIKLTIDKEIDEKIKKVLLDEKYSKYDNISVMLLETETGKIRAMNQKDESYPNINLGMEGIGYEPGSIYKLLTYGAALEEGVITPNTMFKCKLKKCKNTYHGNISAKNALIKSCNDAFGEIGEQIGSKKLIEYAKKLGLYSRVLNIESKNKKEAVGTFKEEDAGIDNLAIGQSMTVAPIQMIGAINTFLNNGVYVKPQIVENILDSNEKNVTEYKIDKKIVFSNLTSSMVKEGMKDVVLYGTGEKAKVDGKTIYGKTGSGTFLDKTHCWFIGGFELNGKSYTMNILVPNVPEDGENSIGGGTVAAPIFSHIVSELSK
ncbi:penicillin-binding transpeptidase domain-containing protein [uncultured Clostridium sp.]|uniref:penicillin-binding transpeptidase domain-containing protein n=1 Tax=uncultured Clostridium sp. TaxID=59620 RepID=UPI002586AE4B|nr:penicillin-binding transpeptidase domain-containing protein [uncultured Clostridium sp.]